MGYFTDYYENKDVSTVTNLDRIFAEEPVGLDVFIKDSKFLNMDGDGLSPIQMEFVQYSERIYKRDMYPMLAKEFGGYWAETENIRMTNLISAEWGKGCLLAGEEIYDAESGQWVSVETAHEGTTAAVTASNEVTVRPRTSSFLRGRGESFKVTTATGLTVKVFAGHQFLTKDGYVQLRNLSVGDKIAQVTKLPIQNPTPLDSREVELIGWWLGDGIMPSGKSGLTMMFSDNEEESMARYAEVCASLGIELTFRRREGKKCWYVNSTRNSGHKRQNALMEIARRYGLRGKTAHNVRVPKAMFSLPDDQVALFLSRLWTTDGHVYASKSKNTPSEAGYVSVSEGMVKDVQRLLLRLGISSEIRSRLVSGYNVTTTAWEVRLRTSADLRAFCTKVPLLDKWRAQNAVMAHLDSKLARKNRERDGDIRYTKIVSIEPLGDHDYYDLTVDVDHNYIAAGGLVNHNSGKDMCSRIISLRIAYLLMCLRSPQEYFGMPGSDSIHMLNIAANAPQAQRAFFEPMTRAVKSGWFADKAEPKKSSIVYDKNLEAISGHSSVDGQEGLNLILGVADEIDAFKTRTEMVGLGRRSREASTSAESILDMLKTSASTRFPEVYKQVTISFPRYKNSKIQQLTAQGKESNAKYGRDSNYYVSGPHATWVVNPLRKREDFKMDYLQNPVEAAAKYECKPAESSNPYFRDIVPFTEAVDRDEEPITINYELVTTVSDITGQEVQQWEAVYTFADWFKPVPGALYAMHGDLAINGDRAGVAMSHVVDWVEKEVTFVNDNHLIETSKESLPVVRNDFTIGFEADIGSQPAREIQIRWARELAFQLIQRGFTVALFTFDGFQSVDSMQLLEASGIETDRVSTDLNNNVWRTLRDVVSDRRLKRPANELLLDELKSLVDLGRKVDHPPNGGKDLADAFACSIVGAITLGGSESEDYAEIQAGDSIFTTPDQMGGLARPEEFGVSLGNMLPIGMTLEAPFGTN